MKRLDGGLITSGFLTNEEGKKHGIHTVHDVWWMCWCDNYDSCTDEWKGLKTHESI